MVFSTQIENNICEIKHQTWRHREIKRKNVFLSCHEGYNSDLEIESINSYKDTNVPKLNVSAISCTGCKI